MKLCAILAFLFWLPVTAPRPSPALTPSDVIRAVAEALQHNNSPLPNAGIFTAYQFASPSNRSVTGPYGHFLQIVRVPAYEPLRSGMPEEFDAIVVVGDRAQQTVHVRIRDGHLATYRFSVSRQARGQYAGCWMVDGVVPLR